MRIIQPYSHGETVAVVAASAFSERERAALPVFSPRGFAYRPLAGDSLLLLPTEGGMVSAGVLSRLDGLAPGEVRIENGGGASIRLCENGDIVLNGVVITRDGEIVGKNGELKIEN